MPDGLFSRRPRPPTFAVDQFLPTLGFRDAVANHTLETRHQLSRVGIGGRIWTEQTHPAASRFATSYEAYQRSVAGRELARILLYQASTGSNGMVTFLLRRPEPKTIFYHNITPADFFQPYDAAAANTLRQGRAELRVMARQLKVAIAASEYNARELRALGVDDVRVIFPWFAPRQDVRLNRPLLQRLQSSKRGIDLLFVGRVVPNKGHVHLLRTFAAIRAAVDPNARLFIAGHYGPQLYMRQLFAIRERLCPEGVVFTGPIDEPSLLAHYRAADQFLCLSEHEGFGLPLIEAMRLRVPVIAYAAGAIPETLAGSGVLVRTLNPLLLAELIGRVAHDASLRNAICEQQEERALELEKAPRLEPLLAALRQAA